jgi:hypothetical protein
MGLRFFHHIACANIILHKLQISVTDIPRIARELASEPMDTSPRQSYTREITLEDIEWMKRHITEHGLDTAVGVDGFSYKDCLAIPNEKLLEFFRSCLGNRTMPRYWLISLLDLEKGQGCYGPCKLPLHFTGMLHVEDAHADY